MAETSSANYDGKSFLFGLNDPDFSDRVLHLLIIPDGHLDSGDGHFDSGKNISGFQDSDSGVKHTTLHINSIIFAAKSPFFYKLFKNGMRESQNKTGVLSLTISDSEETSLMELVNFMYGNTLISTSEQHLVNLLVIADKFEVISCMQFCVDMLLKLPMLPESAMLYLQLPSTILVNDMVKPLVDAAKLYVSTLYKDFTKSRDDLMKLPLSAIEVVLGSEGVEVQLEEDIYEFILEWSRKFYLDLEERREILSKRLAPILRLQNMSCPKLKEMLVCPEFNHSDVSKLVMEALFSKVELPWFQTIHVSNELEQTPQESCLPGRVYSPYYVFSFDIKKDMLERLRAPEYIRFQPFFVGATKFILLAKRYQGEGEREYLDLYMREDGERKTCTATNYQFQVLNKSSMQFQNKFTIQDYDFQQIVRITNLLGITWTELLRDNHDYFINDILYIRLLVKVKTSESKV